jgi:hypothetical protein
MSKTHPSVVSYVAIAALLGACASVDSFVKTADEAIAPTTVQFTYDAVSPQTVTLAPGGNVTWVNNALDVVGFVVFQGSIASSLRCQELRPYLTRLESGEFRTQPITGVVTEQAKLPCALAPGRYDYQVWLMGEGFGDEGIGSAPQKVLHGTIVAQ